MLLGLHVDLAELPLPQQVVAAAVEPALLLLLGDGEVELDEDRALADEVLLEPDDAAHEVAVLLVGAEAEDRLHHRAVVPGAVEQDHLPAVRELGDVALEVPLPALLLGRLAERDDAVVLGVHVARDAPDRPALARGVAALEQDDHAPLLGLEVLLELQQLDLERLERALRAALAHRAASPPCAGARSRR